jgi:hypothetical protein
MAGEAAKSFVTNGQQPDFLVGPRLMKGGENRALRYLCDPPRDGKSIDNALKFNSALDVHYASGVYGKAFCLLAKTPGWDVRKAFGVFLAANKDYWAPNTTFISGGRDVLRAAKDAGHEPKDVIAAFGAVGIAIGEAAPSSWESASASSPAASAGPTAGSGTPDRPMHPEEAMASGHPANHNQDQKAADGEWSIPNSGEVLSIKGGEWFHSKFGQARLRDAQDDADLKVFYTNSDVRCSYRVSFSEAEKTLNLIATDPMQDPDYCPAGTLQRIAQK